MTPDERFKFQFVKKSRESGMSEPQILDAARRMNNTVKAASVARFLEEKETGCKSAKEKSFFSQLYSDFKTPINVGSNTLGLAGGLTVASATALPFVGGMMLAKLKNEANAEDFGGAEDYRDAELIQEYNKATERLRSLRGRR